MQILLLIIFIVACLIIPINILRSTFKKKEEKNIIEGLFILQTRNLNNRLK